jgi:hypothetical protein
MARLQLVAAWDLGRLDDPTALRSVKVWNDTDGTPRGLCHWGSEPLSFGYQAIISTAGPVAEARARRGKVHDCLRAGEDYDVVIRVVERGWLDFDDAVNQARSIAP